MGIEGWGTSRLAALAICIFAIGVAPLSVSAQRGASDDTRAKQHFTVGTSLFEAGRHAEAAKEFESAYDLSKKPALLVNAFIAYRNAGDLENAVRVGDAYIAQAPNSKEAGEIRPALASMKARIAEKQAEQSALEAERAKLAEQAAAEKAAAEQERMRAEQERMRAEQERRRAEVAEASSPVPYIVGGSGVALLVGGLVTGLMANAKVDDIESSCPNQRCPLEFDLSGEKDSANTLALTTDILLGAGAIALTTGVILLLVGPSSDAEEDDHAFNLGCGFDGCSAEALIRF